MAADWDRQLEPLADRGDTTSGRREVPIVIYCSDPQCLLSCQATLQTVAAGFSNVYWYT